MVLAVPSGSGTRECVVPVAHVALAAAAHTFRAASTQVQSYYEAVIGNGCSASIRMVSRIASPKMLPWCSALPHLKCSPTDCLEEHWNEQDEHDGAGNRIADVSALSGLTRPEVLRLDGNRIDDALPLWSLQGLVHLGLADNRIDDVGLLAELRSLKRLDLGGNRVSDVSPLGDLSELVWLRLPGNPVSDAAPLGRLTGLRWLWLDVSPDAGGGRVRVFRSNGTPVGE